MSLAVAAVAITILILILFFQVFQYRRISEFCRKGPDLAPVIRSIDGVHQRQEQIERSVRDEISRSRDSVSARLDGLTRSNDQKLELVRSAMEQHLDRFTTESGRKIDGLTQSMMIASGKLQDEISTRLGEFKSSLDKNVKEGHQLQREQTAAISGAIQSLQASVGERHLRLQTVIDTKLSTISEQTGQKLADVESALRRQAQELLATLTEISQLQKNELHELRSTVDARLATIQVEKLEQMRQTVDEKLQGTLEARLGESFKQVSDRLEQVYKGLDEMQTLAAGVGDLKRVLTGVKPRGIWGEVQLGALLEEILAPDQYDRNVATSGTCERVKYAIKLPGRDSNGAPVWLPIDAKFPLEDYQRLIDASARADLDAVDKASRQLEATIKSCAKNLSEKYVAPPATTDFAILFLPTEGLYAEAMRRVGLAESIRREYRIVLAGPNTLAALLNSFQIGFRTLAIQKRSSEVWDLLGAVKAEFAKYADVLAKVKKKLGEAQSTIDKAETRTRIIQRKLRDVEASDSPDLIEGEQLLEGENEESPTLAGVGQGA